MLEWNGEKQKKGRGKSTQNNGNTALHNSLWSRIFKWWLPTARDNSAVCRHHSWGSLKLHKSACNSLYEQRWVCPTLFKSKRRRRKRKRKLIQTTSDRLLFKTYQYRRSHNKCHAIRSPRSSEVQTIFLLISVGHSPYSERNRRQ